MMLGDLFSPLKPWKRPHRQRPEDSTLFPRVTFQGRTESPDSALTTDSFVEQPSAFASLVEDVVVYILCFCDIASVLSISETCRRLNKVAFEKAVWFSHISDLHSRQFIDLVRKEHLGILSTAQLINLAKRAVQGPVSWSPSYHSSSTILQRQTLISQDFRVPYDVEPLLLSGGQYLLCRCFHILMCWNLKEKRRIWMYQEEPDRSHAWKFAAEVVDEGRVVMIILGLTDGLANFIQVIRLDLLEETSCSVYRARAPDSLYPNVFYNPRICGDFAAICINKQRTVLLLINWRDQVYSLLEICYNSDIQLIPKHLIVIESRSSPTRIILNVYNTHSFVETHQYDTTQPIPLAMVPSMLHDTFSLSTSSTPYTRVFAHMSPIRDNLCMIWAVAEHRSERVARSYQLLLHPVAHLVRSATRPIMDTTWFASHISYSGHIITLPENKIFSLRSISSGASFRSVDVQPWNRFVHVSTYSGALTYSAKNQVFIDHYL